MNYLAIIGAFVITLSLLLYGIGSITVQRFKLVTQGVLIFITLGVISDLIAITLMIFGSEKGPFTLHGVLGFSATITMCIDMLLVWKLYLKNGIDSVVSKSAVLYTRIAYSWWVIAYITGSLLVIW